MAFAPTYGFPGGNSAYIDTLALSGNLMVDYGRNLTKKVNRYSRITPVQKSRGAYLHFDPLSYARQANLPQGPVWAPGTLRPTGFQNTLGFVQRTFQTERFNYPITLDKRMVDLANWPVMKSHTAALGQNAMSHRAYKVCAKLVDTGNYQTTHTATATALNLAGFTSGGTTADPRIKNTLDGAAIVIQRDTLGRVQWGNLSVLINHNTALKWSATREIREYVMQNPDAIKNIRMDDTNYNAQYGLPSKLYNFNLIVEDTYYNPYLEGDTSAVGTPVMDDNKAVVLLAEGDLEQPDGAVSFNTCHVFSYEEMNVETFDDPRHRLIYLDVVMDYDVQIVAPPTGFVITALFS